MGFCGIRFEMEMVIPHLELIDFKHFIYFASLRHSMPIVMNCY